MAIYHKEFYKKVINDFGFFLKSPKSFLRNELENFKPEFVDKKLVAFVVLMHSYYAFIPSTIVMTNIALPIIVFFNIGVFYYLCQVCLTRYQANIGEDQDYSAKKLYVFAYAFSLAELVGLVFSLAILFFNLTDIFSFMSWLLSFLLTWPVALVVIILKLSIFKVAESNKPSILSFLQFLMQAIVDTVKNKFAIEAWQELWADFNSED